MSRAPIHPTAGAGRPARAIARARRRAGVGAAVTLLVIAGWGPAENRQDERRATIADRTRDASAPYLAVRRAALDGVVAEGAEALPVLVDWLQRPDWRLRAAAADGLGRLRRPEARDALVAGLDREQGPRTADAIADALVPYGLEAWRILQARARSGRATALHVRAKERFLWAYVISLVHRILSENTTAGGVFKGFYDGQFEAVAAIGPEAADVLLRMVGDAERFPVLVRQFAVRAMAEVGNRRHVPPLRTFHERLLKKYGPADYFSSMSYSDEQELMVFARRVLARLGHLEPCRQEITRLQRQIRLWSGASEGRAGHYQYELAYEWHQVRDYGRATQEYRRYLDSYPREVLDFTNSRHYAWYNLACIAARLQRKADALTYLEQAFLEDYTDFAWLELDRDLDPIRELAAYRELVDRYRMRLMPKGSPRD